MKAILIFLLAAMSLPLRAVERPNVMVVLIDDMGWGDLSCFGNLEVKTPNLDRLADEGIRFESFYVNAPICSPSRCALVTGQYPQRWKITSFLDHRAANERRGMAQWLDPEAPSLGRFLQGAGYATGHFGKWHLGGQRDVDRAPAIAAYGYDRSLTNFEGMGPKLLPLTMKPGDREPGRIWQDAERLGGPVTWMPRAEITGAFAKEAMGFMEKARGEGKPFYVNVWPDDVHSPFWPPVDQWAQGKRGLYLSVLREMDRQLGVLFEYVRSTPGLRESTMILVCSDNGHEPGAGRAGPFRGGKGTLWEGGIRSPLIVWGAAAGVDARGRGKVNRDSVFAAFDLVPSVLAITGVEVAKEVVFDGEDISAVLRGTSDGSRTKPLFWRRPPDRKRVGEGKVTTVTFDLAMREGKWKLLCDYDGSRAELYDVVADRGETKNLAGEEPERVERMKAAVVAWHRTMPADRGPELGRSGG